jgi:hypothetical protein
MRFYTLAGIGLAFSAMVAGPAIAQRVCQPGDTECSNSRMYSQREQTLRHADRAGRRDGSVRSQRDSGWEQYRKEQVHGRSAPVCDSKPIISGGVTRVVPTC